MDTTKIIPERRQYSDSNSTFIDIYRPTKEEATPRPVVVLYHGGFFKDEYPASFGQKDDPPSKSYMETLALDLVGKGYVAVVAEYLRVPRKADDAKAEIPKPTSEEMIRSVYGSFDEVKNLFPESKITAIGHSAGGYYVACLAMREKMSETLELPVGAIPDAVVCMAPVLDLKKGQRDGLSDEHDAIKRFVDCGLSVESGDERYERLSPINYDPPKEVQFKIVHGAQDADVPVEGQSDAFRERHPEVDLVVLDGANHYSFLDPADNAWKKVLECILKDHVDESSEIQRSKFK